MSRVSLFVLFLVLNIAVQIGDCDDTPKVNCDEKITPASEKTILSLLEKKLQFIQKIGDLVGAFFGQSFKRLKEILDKLTKHFKTEGKEYRGSENRSFESDIQLIVGDKEIRAIFPGTRWCGDGDIAKKENDLGLFNKTDTCCRAHDHCQSNIVAGESMENLINNGIFTRSACACDNAFFNCLKNVKTIISEEIGKTYFNILGQQCFKCICPTDDCNANTSSTECKDQCNRYQWVNSTHF